MVRIIINQRASCWIVNSPKGLERHASIRSAPGKQSGRFLRFGPPTSARRWSRPLAG
jgi:hypothetical protein